MPNRILRDWTQSEKIDLLSFESEVFLVRLFMKADDYGSFISNTKLIKSLLFPLKDNISERHIEIWLKELESAELIFFYEVDNKKYLRIYNFGQRLRNMRNAYPHPKNSNLTASCGNSPLETKRNETEVETKQKRNEKENYDSEKELYFFFTAENEKRYYLTHTDMLQGGMSDLAIERHLNDLKRIKHG